MIKPRGGPFIAIKVEALRLNPELLPLRVLPLLVKSMEFANPATGSASASKSKHAILFIAYFLLAILPVPALPFGGKHGNKQIS
jgi:hypothetical protein